jgi:hypothetical protein
VHPTFGKSFTKTFWKGNRWRSGRELGKVSVEGPLRTLSKPGEAEGQLGGNSMPTSEHDEVVVFCGMFQQRRQTIKYIDKVDQLELFQVPALNHALSIVVQSYPVVETIFDGDLSPSSALVQL